MGICGQAKTAISTLEEPTFSKPADINPQTSITVLDAEKKKELQTQCQQVPLFLFNS